jgi:predicted short-subunit dehydrogenase-like oxidoreductase (DUF2520 family)
MRIVLLGTGNLATQLGLALQMNHHKIVQVVGRTESSTIQLARLLASEPSPFTNELSQEAELYLLAISDDAIPQILPKLSLTDKLIVHTSGSLPMELLAGCSKNYGVIYPLQTLSKQREVDFRKVPLCIEGSSQDNLALLEDCARSLSDQVFHVDSEHRRQLHLAAVFVCNFVNHMYSIGEQLLADQQLDFNLLKPLILETAEKAVHFSPSEVQTGPAVRGNQRIMDLHAEMLERYPAWQKLYKTISSDILTHHNPNL